MDPLRPVSPQPAPPRPVAPPSPPPPLDDFTPGEPVALDLRRAAALLAGGEPRPDVVWTVLATGGRFTTPPALGPSGLAVGTSVGVAGGGRVALLDPDTGGERWRVDLPHEPEWCAQGPDGTVYVGGRFGFLQALDPADGSPRWRLEVGEHLSEPPTFLPDGTMACLKGGRLVARDPRDGQPRWAVRGILGLREGGLATTPDGGVLVHADNGLFCFEGATGRTRWHREEATTAGAVSNGSVVAGAGHKLLELDPADGAVRREIPLPGSVVAAPAAAGGTVVVPLRGSRLLALDGPRKLWDRTVYTDVTTFLVPVGDRLLLAGNRGLRGVNGLDPGSGRRLWGRDGETAALGPAATDGRGRAWLASSDALVCLGEEPVLAEADGPAGEPRSILVGEEQVSIGEVDLPVRRD